MFHVEHFMKTLFYSIFFVLFSLLVGCNQPNPHPETLDPIYSDIEKEKKEVDGAYAAEKKNLEDLQQDLLDVKPQTGQIKYAQKRILDSKERLNVLYQRKIYLQLRLETRLAQVSKDYLRAFEKGHVWPDPKEYIEYKSQKSLERAPKIWSVSERISRSTPPKKPTGGHGDSESHGEEHH
jgi:hypothetical protein